MLQKQNRLQVPKLVRWEYKLEASDVLQVTVNIIGLLGVREQFLAKMQKDGRIAIPKLTMPLLMRDEQRLEGYAMEVTLEPTWSKPLKDRAILVKLWALSFECLFSVPYHSC